MCVSERFCKCHMSEQQERKFWEKVVKKLQGLKRNERNIQVGDRRYKIVLEPIGEYDYR